MIAISSLRRLTSRKGPWLVLLALAATLWSLSAPLYLDAVSRIGLNPDIRSLAHLWDRLVYPPSEYFNWDRNDPSRPVVFALYTLIWAVSPNSAFGFRLLNLIFHALNGLLVYAVCRQVLKQLDDTSHEAYAFVTAALFLISPVNVGTAIYTYALNDILALTFSLSMLLTFGRWVASNKRMRWSVLTLLAFVLGVFSKQSVAVMPLALLAYDYFVLSHRQRGRIKAHATLYLLLVATTAAYLLWRRSYFGQIGDVEGLQYVWNRWTYLEVQPEVWWRYIALLLLPVGSSFDHQLELPQTGGWLLHVLVPWALALLALAAAVRIVRRRSSWHAAVTFALTWFVVQVAPTSSLMPTVDAMVERRVYGASIGIYLLLAIVAIRAILTAATPRRLQRQRLCAVISGGVVLAFLGLSVGRSSEFRDPVATWKRVFTLYPTSVRAMSNLAVAHLEQKNYAAALGWFTRAAERQSYSFTTWYNLGRIYANRDSGFYDPETAITMYRRTLETNRGYLLAFFPLAKLLQLRADPRDIAEAETLYRKAIAAGQEPVDARNNLGLLEAKSGEREAARQHFREALELAPNYAPARTNLELLEQGRLVPGQR